MMNRRRTLALVAALATAFVVPATASASTAHRSASAEAPVELQRRIQRNQLLRNQWTANYKKWSESRMRSAHWRIMMKSRNKMSHEKRAQLGRDLNEAVRVLRQRIDNLGRDNVISVNDQKQILGLRDAIRRDLARQYGSFDSFSLL